MKQLKGWIVAITLLVLLSACGQNEQESEASGGTNASNDQQEEQNEDNNVNDENNQENEVGLEETGKLTIYTSGPGGMAQALVDAFEEKTGIQVDVFQGTTGDVLGRLEAEEGNPIADVVVLASLPPAMDYKDRGLTLSYESPFANQLHDGWYDEEFHFYGFSASALGLSYNTNLVEEPPTDWSDLTDEKYNGKLAIPDPTQSGTARDFLAAFIHQEGDAGWEFLEQLKENGLQLEGANNPALQTVITGANSVVMAGVDYMVYNNIANGEPVDIVFPSSGTMITPRPAFILETAKNVSSAQQYIDFILSDEGQKIVADAYLIPARVDVAAAEDRLGMEHIETLQYDWSFLEENTQDILDRFMEIIR
ncbi:extracellular solute-binding protein [Evansella sp. AB-rgal1]|uniref:extracellular solute-binding protein n=1 Tax=Evansella sp. AB-rgal1 TaxID=3242696 RepID=UPI00359E7235